MPILEYGHVPKNLHTNNTRHLWWVATVATYDAVLAGTYFSVSPLLVYIPELYMHGYAVS